MNNCGERQCNPFISLSVVTPKSQIFEGLPVRQKVKIIRGKRQRSSNLPLSPIERPSNQALHGLAACQKAD